MNIKAYDIIKKNEAYDLIREVRERMDRGWQPLGGICVSAISSPSGFSGRVYYIQAIVKYGE